MTKKTLNQNAKYFQKLINTIEPDFVFVNKSINRFKIVKNNNNNVNQNKSERLSDLKKQINSIENCNLKDNSKNFIMGDGDINSPIMLIGEAPGATEDSSGLSFQGDVGALLNKMLLAINIKREKVYSTYSINFRPPEDRKPTGQEIKRYSIFLKEHISIINPKIVILIGSTAMETVTGLNNKISNERGKWKEIILKNKTFPLMITFSPSYLIRFPENKKYSWEDLKKNKTKNTRFEYQNLMKIIAGVDEVGRGSLIGPVYAAAVILKKSINRKLLKDSKSLTKTQREILAKYIKKNSIWALGKASVKEIEKINILNASLLAMKRAIKKLKKKPSLILIDGNKLPKIKNYKLKSIIKGDQKIPSISAASIIAKVTRDKIITILGKKFKGYYWNQNYGYGTKQHLKAIRNLGITTHHRKTFSPINKIK